MITHFVESKFFYFIFVTFEPPSEQEKLLLPLFFKLRIIQLCIKSVLCKKLIMCTLLDNVSILHDKNHIGILDSRQPVGDDKACSVLHQIVECLLDTDFCTCIDRGCGLIKDQDRIVCKNGSCYCQSCFCPCDTFEASSLSSIS